MARWEPDAEGRLTAAALTLFHTQGYDQTTVESIAAAAGLTKRTFFRYFADKREVLFNGSHELEQRWVDAIAGAPPQLAPMVAVDLGLSAVAELFTERHAFAQVRAQIVDANSELRERELIKLQTLSTAIEHVLAKRGVAANTATLAAQAGVTVFHVAFARWVAQDDPTAFRRLLDDTLSELRVVTAG